MELTTPHPTFQRRVQNVVAELSTRKEQLQSDIQKLDAQITKLTLIAEGNEDPELEDIFIRVLNAPAPQEIQAISIVSPPAPPEKNIPRIKVTCDGIYALTQTFDRLFTLNDMVDLLADNEGVTDAEEKTRVRSAVYTMMRKLIENGRLIQHEKGIGKRPGWFRKVVTTDYRRLPAFKNGQPEDIEISRTTSSI